MTTAVMSPDVAHVLAENHRRFLAFLSHRVASREVAEDLLQDAFIRGLTKAPPLQSPESILAWFYRVLRNALVDHYRRTGAEDRALERYAAEAPTTVDPATEDPELFDEVYTCVRSLISTLKPEYAAAIARVDLDGASLDDLAREAGITPNNAGVRLHRAHKALQRRVRETCETCADHGCYQCQCRHRHPDVSARTTCETPV
jgi:RNA polymerase sigma factor (sigma-70 family)